MALTLSVVDRQDGTGATATIAGSDVGQLATVYTWPVAVGNSPPAWAAAGSRVGDGPLALPVAPAYYYAHVRGAVGGLVAVSPPIIFLASRSTDSVYDRILAGTHARVQGLALAMAGLSKAPHPATLPAARVLAGEFIDPQLTPAFPAVWITPPEQGSEQVREVVNGADDLGWPVVVSIVDRRDPREAGAIPTYRRWREQLSRALRFQRLPGVPEVYRAAIEPQAMARWVVQGEGSGGLYFTSTLQFRFWTRDPRGV